jgi:protoporphyrinogen oxidase
MEEIINIKFDEKQLDDIVKRVTENIIKESKKDSITELTIGKQKEKRSLMYLDVNISGYSSEKKKVYFGHGFHTLTKEIASEFDLTEEVDRKKVEELKKQGWKEEVVYK